MHHHKPHSPVDAPAEVYLFPTGDQNKGIMRITPILQQIKIRYECTLFISTTQKSKRENKVHYSNHTADQNKQVQWCTFFTYHKRGESNAHYPYTWGLFSTISDIYVPQGIIFQFKNPVSPFCKALGRVFFQVFFANSDLQLNLGH